MIVSRMVWWVLLGLLAVGLGAGYLIASSRSAEQERIFQISCQNLGPVEITEARARFDGFDFSWGHLMHGGGASFNDHHPRIPPTEAWVSWKSGSTQFEKKIQVPHSLPVVVEGGKLELVFLIDGKNASAQWIAIASVSRVQVD